MDVNTYCTYQDIIDIIPTSVVGTNDGQVTEEQVRRLIIKQSARIEHWNNDIPFAETTVTDEYHEMFGLDKFYLSKIPVISVTSLSLEETPGEWTTKDQGRNENSDDYFLEDTKSGIIRYHNVPTYGVWCKVTYKHGYAETPYWLRDLCSKMVALEIFKLKNFDEECTSLVDFWRTLITSYRKEVDEYKEKIRKNVKKAKFVGSRYSTTPQYDLSTRYKWVKLN